MPADQAGSEPMPESLFRCNMMYVHINMIRHQLMSTAQQSKDSRLIGPQFICTKGESDQVQAQAPLGGCETCHGTGSWRHVCHRRAPGC